MRFAIFEDLLHDRWGRADPPNRRRSPQEPHASPNGSKLEVDKIMDAQYVPRRRRRGTNDGLALCELTLYIFAVPSGAVHTTNV